MSEREVDLGGDGLAIDCGLVGLLANRLLEFVQREFPFLELSLSNAHAYVSEDKPFSKPFF